jgi:hypothetical protein
MRAQDLLKQYRKSINPPYNRRSLISIIATIFILIILPLTAIGVNQARQLNIQAAATLNVNPNPVPALGGEYTVTGSGYYTDQPVSINMHDPGCCLAFDVWPGSSGNISFTRTTGSPGTYKVEAYQKENNKQVLMAQISFEVVEMEKQGDLNGDGVVNIFDLSILLSNWGTSNQNADLNNDGKVDIFDLSILLSNWDG